jgi:predicted ribosomally synthesized peptide with SipW-like signal peptide
MAEDGTIRLNRRGLLGAVGVVGTAAAGAGLGTQALFNDTESFTANSLTAGDLDLKVAWKQRCEFDGTTREATSNGWPDPQNDADAPVVDLDDVKPGDSGDIRFKLRVDSNPGYLWLLGAEEADEERSTTESERDGVTGAVPVGAEGELDELTATTLAYEDDETTTAYRTSLASLVGLGGVGNGLPLDGGWSTPVVDLLLGDSTVAAFPAGRTRELRIDWEVPPSIGNGIQSDSYRFRLGFYTEQARNDSR